MDYLDIFVGTDRSQLLAVAVLEFSIKRHTSHPIRVVPLIDLDLPEPKDIRQSSRTNFSFARFAIPEIRKYSGMGLYLDADMLVFRDISEIWKIDRGEAKILIQGALDPAAQAAKVGAPTQRKKQCSVMLMDCSRLDWRASSIIAGLDGRYTYEELMSQMCILDEQDVSYDLPFRWNSLEHFDETTCLIHYTDMHTQPWVDVNNRFGYLWMWEVHRMLLAGVLSWRAIEREIELGYFRPSLAHEIREIPELKVWNEQAAKRYAEIDKQAGFIKHKEVYERKTARAKAVKAYEASLQVKAAEPHAAPSPVASAAHAPAALLGSAAVAAA
ncbi:MAG TPA: glycosyltransferase [Caulobacteraceae bacterium]